MTAALEEDVLSADDLFRRCSNDEVFRFLSLSLGVLIVKPPSDAVDDALDTPPPRVCCAADDGDATVPLLYGSENISELRRRMKESLFLFLSGYAPVVFEEIIPAGDNDVDRADDEAGPPIDCLPETLIAKPTFASPTPPAAALAPISPRGSTAKTSSSGLGGLFGLSPFPFPTPSIGTRPPGASNNTSTLPLPP